MRKIYGYCMAALTAMLAITSCMESSQSTIVYNGDAAVSAFRITEVKRTMYTKKSKSDEDSMYISKLTPTQYAFTIDHISEPGLIYNLDSLPKGCNAAKCITDITAKNGGYIYFTNLEKGESGEDTWSLYQTTDTVDLSKQREIFILSDDGLYKKRYIVDVRVHKEAEDSMTWIDKSVNTAFLADNLQNIKSTAVNDYVLVYGVGNDGKFKVYRTKDTDNFTANAEVMRDMEGNTITFSKETTIATSGDALFALSDGNIYLSVDGATWVKQTKTQDTSLKAIVNVDRKECHALTTSNGIKKSTDLGATWTDDIVDGDTKMLPNTDITGYTISTTTNGDVRAAYIFGNIAEPTEANGTETTAHVWMKVIDEDDYENKAKWDYLPFGSNNNYKAPALHGLCIIPYHGGLLLIGGKPYNGCQKKAFDGFYFSNDRGLTWKTDKRYSFPEGFNTETDSFTFTMDMNGHFWLVDGSTGHVWRGKLNQETWMKVPFEYQGE